jgi:hypothetical protein
MLSLVSSLWSDHEYDEGDLERQRATYQRTLGILGKAAGGGGVAASAVKAPEEQAAPRPSKTAAPPPNTLETAAARSVAQLAARSLAGMSFERYHGVVTGEFKCPSFVQMDWKRASIPATLSQNSELIREELMRLIGDVPEKTFIKFTYDFKRDAARKLLDMEGEVKVTLKW